MFGVYLIVDKTFFVFISSVLLAEEIFKLCRMIGDSLTLFGIKEFNLLMALLLSHIRLKILTSYTNFEY